MKKRKILAYLLILILAVSMMSGCGGKAGTPDTTKTSSTKDETSAAKGDNNGSQKELVTLRIMGRDNAATLADQKVTLSDWVNKDSKLWKKVTDDLEERGIRLDLDLIQDDQFDTVVQTQLAAGIDCDIMNITPLDSITRLRLMEQGSIVPINKILDQYSDGTAKEFYTSGPGANAVGMTSLEDGNFYWLTDIQTSTYDDKVVGSTMGFQIRKDWLDKLGLPVPSTTDELFTDLQAFQDKDMNGSGEKDEVISIDLKGFATGIGQWFGFGPGLTYVDEQDGNKVKSPWYNDHIKDYISFVKKMVDAGLVDTSDQASVKKPENKIAGLFGWAMATWDEPQVIVPDGAAKAYYLPFLAKAVEDVEPLGILQSGYQISGRGYAVTNKCKHPEAVAKLLDYITSPEFTELTEYGIRDYTFTQDANGNKTRIKDSNPETQIMSSVPALWTNNAIFPRYDIGKHMEAEMNQMVETGKLAGYPDEGYQAKWDFSDKLYKYPYTTGHDPEAAYATATAKELDRISAIETDLTTYSDELMMKLILGQKSLEDWDTYMSDLKRLGLDELISINQARYDRTQK